MAEIKLGFGKTGIQEKPNDMMRSLKESIQKEDYKKAKDLISEEDINKLIKLNSDEFSLVMKVLYREHSKNKHQDGKSN